MCGIAGILSTRRDPSELEEETRTAIRMLHHRGPDDQGVWTDAGGLALGHARLAILDLSPLGHQPMQSASGRLVMSFNGEIYNFREIRARLEAEGVGFRGTGDSEVILAAFDRWGPRAVDEFIGMFALALWNGEEGSLELYRDRMGVKPLYYSETEHGFSFASELKALRAFAGWDDEIDRTALGEYFQFGYVAGARTIYRNARKLLPGHRLVKRPDSPVHVTRYWECRAGMHSGLPKDPRELDEELEALLADAFRYRMVSDVPVGVFLSGGVDSSLVTALLARDAGAAIRTFTIGFRGTEKDESVWAKRVAQHCGTNHTEYQLEGDAALEIAHRWGSLFDEPFGDSSGIPTYLVSRMARQDVKVALSADGGDELFSGYEVYARTLERSRRLTPFPRPLRATAGALLGAALPGRLGPRAGSRVQKLHRLAMMMRRERLVDGALDYLSYLQPKEVSRLIGGYKLPRAAISESEGAAIDQLSLWDIGTYLPEDILTKVDRTTMAVSLEGREPLLDHRIAEFALSMPPSERRGEFGAKTPLKRILYRHVPRELVDRPKRGFSIPLAQWLRHELRELVEDLIRHDRIRDKGILDPDLVERMKSGFYAGNPALCTPLWFLLAFELWHEEWGGI